MPKVLLAHADQTKETLVQSESGSEMKRLTSIEICAGGGGQALGLEQAGFEHAALVEIDGHACATLRANRAHWNVVQADLREFSARDYEGVDLFAGGVPCPPFSKAGKQLGAKDDRDMFPEAIRLIRECRPKAVMLENVRGLFDAVFDDYRLRISNELKELGYTPEWELLNASQFGVPQSRPRALFVAISKDVVGKFSWPQGKKSSAKTVGEALFDLMAANGWRGARRWKDRANEIAPTLVGGSKKHGGPDLGPTRAKKAWATLSVDGHGLWDDAPGPNFSVNGVPRLTTSMAARLQGFPDDWKFSGGKTAAYRQIGNAFPPPVAFAVGSMIAQALSATRARKVA